MKKYGRYSLLSWSWRILLGIALTPILLFLLLFVLIYTPPVQKYAVDRAAEWLSEEMGMDVTVEEVSLKFPLDLSMGGMLAVQDGDTVVAARELDVSVRALPLFHLKAEVDGIHLYDAKVNTRQLIDACVVKGTLAELSLDSHSTDLKEEVAVVNRALLRDADLTVLLADTVPEDTTESEPVRWKLDLQDVELQRVRAAVLLSPQADSTYVTAHVGHAQAKAYLDLGEEIYRVSRLQVDGSSAGFDLRKEPRLPDRFDPNHLLFSQIALEVDSFEYKGTGEMQLNLKRLEGVERTGLAIREARGRVEMDSVSLTVPTLHVKTADSDLSLAYRMDMNAFDEVAPGSFSFLGEGLMGKGDIVYFTQLGGEDTREVAAMLNGQLSARPVEVQLKAEGNLEELVVKRLWAKVPGMALVEGEATLWDVADDLSLKTDLSLKDVHGASASVNGSYVMALDAYKADVTFNNWVLNNYVPMDDHTVLTGKASVHGRGFDFLAPGAQLEALASLTNGQMGTIDLSNIEADVSLKGGQLTLALQADNDQVQTDLTFDGELKKHLVAGVLNLNLPFVDVQRMGLSENMLQVSTSGTMEFSYNLDKLFRIEADVDALRLKMANDSIQTAAFSLMAEARKDTTSATLRTGDLDFSFFTPSNVFNLLPKMERLQRETVSQFQKHDVNLYDLKSYLPDLTIYAHAGRNNPVSDILKMYGIRFDELEVDVESSPVEGLTGRGHVYAFQTDSVRIDTAFFDVKQDSLQFNYHAGMRCSDQPLLPAFRAYLDGYVKADEVDAHLTYFDKKDRKGIDLGVRGVADEKSVHFSLYPQKPVLAYREFAINEDNYIITRPDQPIMADVRLASTSDS